MIPPKSKWCSIAIERMLQRNPDVQKYIHSLTDEDAQKTGLTLFQFKVSEELSALQKEADQLNMPAYDLIIRYIAETPEQIEQMTAIRDMDKHDQKSMYNQEKNDIDFETAQRLWDDSDLLEIPVNVKGDSRSICIGRLNGQFWTVLINYIASDVHILSARRSRKEEVTLYYGS